MSVICGSCFASHCCELLAGHQGLHRCYVEDAEGNLTDEICMQWLPGQDGEFYDVG